VLSQALAYLLVGQRRGEVEDQGGNETKSSHGVEESSKLVGAGGDHVGVLCEIAGSIDHLNGDHLGRGHESRGRDCR
jgi:hypothetical protein